jgi:hypothetical protein
MVSQEISYARRSSFASWRIPSLGLPTSATISFRISKATAVDDDDCPNILIASWFAGWGSNPVLRFDPLADHST